MRDELKLSGNTSSSTQEPVLQEDIKAVEDTTVEREDNGMVKFLIGEEKVMFEEDLCLLVSSSPIFFKMFCGSLKEEGPVHITDTTPEAFSAMLKFLNDDSIPLPKDEIIAIYFLAEKYMIQKLKKACMMKMRPTVDTVCTVLNLTVQFNIEDLTQEALRVFSDKTDVILKKPKSFNLLSKEALIVALQCETMANTSESQIFDAVVAWAKYQCEQQGVSCDGEQLKQLEGVLKHIRFLNMTSEEFNKVKESGVLTSQQVEEYDKYTRSKGAIKPKLLYPVARPRKNINYCTRVPYRSFAIASLCNHHNYCCRSGEKLTESIDIKVLNAYLNKIILPTQETADNTKFTYLEELTITATSTSGANNVGTSTVKYRAEVSYNNEICITLPSEVHVYAGYVLSVTITFHTSGCYPFYVNKSFGTNAMLHKTGGIIIALGFDERRSC